MLTILLSIVICLIGFVVFNKAPIWHDGWLVTSVCMMIVGGILAVIAICYSISIQIGKDIEYQNMLYKKEVIEYRIEQIDENVVGNELLYGDIVGFNNALRTTKKWANNPWTNLFWNDMVAEIDYIELPVS